MSRNSTQHVCLSSMAAAVLLCRVVSAGEQAPDPNADVIVCIRDDVFLSGDPIAVQARKTAAAMFSEIGVRVAWAADRFDRKGPANGASTAVVLQLHIVDRSQPGTRERTLAYAYPFGSTKTITIMWDRLQAACRSLPGLAPAVLAHVMVHEITHVLEGVDHHSAAGVMKASWTLADYRQMYRKPLPFAAGHASLVQSGLARLRRLPRTDVDPH